MRTLKIVLIGLVVLFTTGFSFAHVDVRSVALDEIATIESRGYTLPKHSLVIVDRYGTLGDTIITAEPVRYVIVLWSWYYTSDQLRFVSAHEVGHAMLSERGVTQSEDLADRFALCNGSDGARRWARIKGATGDCYELKRLLK